MDVDSCRSPMVAQPAADKDAEAQLKSGGGGGGSRCLLAFLVTSVVLLFVAVAAVAAVLAKVTMEPPRGSQGTTAGPIRKEGRCSAYVHVTDKTLGNQTVSFAASTRNRSVGDNFRFDEDRRSLTPQREGKYLVYVDVKLTCVYRCAAALVRLQVDGGVLSCELPLPATADRAPVSRRCSAEKWLGVRELHTQMTVLAEGPQLENWRLEPESSGWGMTLMMD